MCCCGETHLGCTSASPPLAEALAPPCVSLPRGSWTATALRRASPVKTNLIQALTGDAAAQPRDQLFATLDMTAYAGSLPSRLTVLYVDTIGFPSRLAHELVASSPPPGGCGL
ncbi:putative GTP-binding protein 6 [Echinops telfairi]|uniref:GTP-binding protein 6 n=3 Tax=Echinops telfairi TaxID=9371 RepID=A0AC55DL09_ECHTE|nr:putative GTP-binding protein 6 [Echinops telfairi]XP_045152425.1 putative GTP-binding protein 6 [Echinops telfairi]XP_045152426.1 putative GTP-binding protein 6 [Echinops telfairi]